MPGPINHSSASAETTSGSGFFDVTLTFSATLGNVLIVETSSYFPSIHVTNITDPDHAGNTFTKDVDQNFSSGTVTIWRSVALVAVPTKIRVFVPSGNYLLASVIEVNGLDAAPLDKQAATDSNGATYSSGLAATTTAPNELLLGVHHFSPSNSATWTPDAPWASYFTAHGAGYQSLDTKYQIVSATGAYASTGTSGPGGSAIIVTYKLASAGSTYTVTADGGSYGATGTAAALKATRVLAAAGGSFTATGTAATLRHGYVLAAAGAVFTSTGSAAALRYGRGLAASPGVYALTGTPATLRLARVLLAVGGTFAATGTPAALRVARRLSATSGAYGLTGTAATLTYSGAAGSTYTLAAVGGVYAATGTAATLRYQRRELATGGTYAAIGTPAALRVDRRLALAGGVFTCAGAAVALRRGYHLAADAGSFTASGSAATLHRTRALAASAGVYAWTGSPVTLIYRTGHPPPAAVVTATLQVRTRVSVER